MKTRKVIGMMLVCIFVAAVFSACGDKSGGKATIELDDGSVYIGEASGGVPNGEGTLTDIMGSEWKGTFSEGKMQGYGTYFGYDLVEYEGFFKDGEFEGYGHWLGSNGDDFKGMFVGGEMNGFGRMEYTTGCFYEGGWNNGVMHGMGWMTWPVGDAYFGQWANGDPSGFGCKVFYDPAFAEKDDFFTYNWYVGGIESNMPNGFGLMRFGESGGMFLGNWEDGIRNDTDGVYYFESGIEFLKFEGEFSKSKNSGWIWGEGTMWYADGRVVTGIFEGTDCVEEHSSAAADIGAVKAEAQGLLDSMKGNSYVSQAIGALDKNG